MSNYYTFEPDYTIEGRHYAHPLINWHAIIAGALVAIAVGFVLNATKRGVKVHDLEIALEGNFSNILKWAGHSDTGNPGYPSIKAKVFVKADADEATLREIWKAAVEGSPVTQTVTRPTEIIPEFEAL